MCKDPNVEPLGPCACEDRNCPLNSEDHECEEDESVMPCECGDEECVVGQRLEREQRERVAAGLAVSGVRMAVTQGVRSVV